MWCIHASMYALLNMHVCNRFESFDCYTETIKKGAAVILLYGHLLAFEMKKVKIESVIGFVLFFKKHLFPSQQNQQ